MFRSLKLLFFTGLAASAVLAAVLVYTVKFDASSYLGQRLREQLIRFPVLVSSINLNQPGDARLIYLNPRFASLKVNVIYLPGISPDVEVASWLQQMTLDTVGKTAEVQVSAGPEIPQREFFKDRELNDIRKSFGKTDTRTLNVFYLTGYLSNPQYLGVTLHRDTVFIFKNRIQELSRDPVIRKLLERSTLMHEWGHLLGLEHVSDAGCVMSEFVETYENRDLTEAQIPITHCVSTLYDLKMLQEKYQ